MKYYLLIAFVLILSCENLFTQEKVGVVLSGGGASGMAHIGVLRALEENQIPIDFIVGTSVGALVGGFYAAGYSPDQIAQMVTSEEFQDAANGIIEEQYVYFLKQADLTPSMISWNFNFDSLFATNIPTNFVSPVPIDYGLMELLSPASAAANQNFDSLMIPFRSIAANISAKRQEVFKNGQLAPSIRASMTYPFFLTPIRINGDLMMDGGLYNNFPVDILCQEFDPDYIIASNVTSNLEEPNEDNLISQIRNMLIRDVEFSLPCAKGIIIDSQTTEFGTFSFDYSDDIIALGYKNAIQNIDSIQNDLKVSYSTEEFAQRRESFNRRKPELNFKNIEFEGIHKNQAKYFRNDVFKFDSTFGSKALKPIFMRYASDDKIKSIYPIAKYDSSDQLFVLDLDFKAEKKFKASFGGVISTKPISTGFFELDYKTLGSTGLNVTGNVYFGGFYSSTEAKVKWGIPFDVPFYLQAQYTVNQFDYFNSRSVFIEENDPPYIISAEQFAEASIGLPFLTKSKITSGISYLKQNYSYYQSDNFNRNDTSDLTTFEGYSTFAKFEINSLNHRMYASKGTQVQLMVRNIIGKERTKPGSLFTSKNDFVNEHNWIILKGKIEKYFFRKRNFRLGGLVEGVYSDQPFFQNYTATLLNLPAFQPIPESETIFLERYRALSYLGLGLKTIFSIRDKVDFRLEGYLFQPYEEIIEDENNRATLGKEISEQNFISSFTTVYHTRVGPIAASLNYYDNLDQQFSFLVHFGYILFNKKSYE